MISLNIDRLFIMSTLETVTAGAVAKLMALDEETVVAASLSEGELRSAFEDAAKWQSWRGTWARPVGWTMAGSTVLFFSSALYGWVTGTLGSSNAGAVGLGGLAVVIMGTGVAREYVGERRRKAFEISRWAIKTKALDQRQRLGSDPKPL